MRWILVSILAIAACGGSSVEWTGKWKQALGIPPGSYVEVTFAGTDAAVSGSGVQHREAGADVSFTVTGTRMGGIFFDYQDATREMFSMAQADRDHLTLQNPQRTVNLIRE